MSKHSAEFPKGDTRKFKKKTLMTNTNVEVYNIVLMHVRHSLTDLTQPTDAVQLTVVLHCNDP